MSSFLAGLGMKGGSCRPMRSLLHVLGCGLACLGLSLMAGGSGASHAQPVKAIHESAFDAGARAESRLMQALLQLNAGDLNEAIQEVEALLTQTPNFRSAQLVYSDLLRLRSGLALNQGQDADRTHLLALQSELRQRLAAYSAPPPADAIPAQFLRLDASVRHAIAVDAEKSRLYLFANGAQGLSLIGDFYISVGKLGVDKREEGDQKTPLGLYFTTGQIPGKKLPDLYGVGALPVNYPNDWDRMHGRTGSGIWLHGSPSDQFARVPQASDGCVVLANPDMALLMQVIERRTPVLFAPQLNWVKQAGAQEQPSLLAFEQILRRWETARRSAAGMGGLDAYYTTEFLQSTHRRNQLERQAKHYADKNFRIESSSVYAWSDAMGELRIVNVRATSAEYPAGLSLRQYWRKHAGQWQIFSEDVLAEVAPS
ncbi:hypothetical protein E9531_16925 [Lampropedia puyangensis]|uniref:L,D-TPase catalytic domain-containing protein n=1 Tax=Lampropedia puyangensis TaxID=1330072 RepID=A0A4V4GQ12_9BURK|nr:L,D-transpeptidase family protein [Lampropedia puyangensis]THT95965.1 hypothetical protein E9531_16925 [Lampropedia puyangensis]